MQRARTARRPPVEEPALSARATPSCGNVFADLGFPPAEAENLRVRATLIAALRAVIAERALTQARAASLFGVTQPRVSDLVRGRIELFSIDTLVNMLARAGLAVEVQLGRRLPDGEPAQGPTIDALRPLVGVTATSAGGAGHLTGGAGVLGPAEGRRPVSEARSRAPARRTR